MKEQGGMCVAEFGCVGVPISMCVCVCVCLYVYVCVCVYLCVCRKRGRGDIYFGKTQQLCMPPSMFGLLLCIFMEG